MTIADKGPWTPGMTTNAKVFVECDGVRMNISGGFSSMDASYLYACGIAKQLNSDPKIEADAARYRWLFGARTEAECADEDVCLKPIKPQDMVLSELSGFYAHKEYVDAIVDAAMCCD